MKPLYRGLYRDDPRQPQPPKPRAPRPKKPAPTAQEKREAKLDKARDMVKLWQRKLYIATTRVRKWERRAAQLERQNAIDAAVAKAVAVATVPAAHVRRKITLEGA